MGDYLLWIRVQISHKKTKTKKELLFDSGKKQKQGTKNDNNGKKKRKERKERMRKKEKGRNTKQERRVRYFLVGR